MIRYMAEVSIQSIKAQTKQRLLVQNSFKHHGLSSSFVDASKCGIFLSEDTCEIFPLFHKTISSTFSSELEKREYQLN